MATPRKAPPRPRADVVELEDQTTHTGDLINPAMYEPEPEPEPEPETAADRIARMLGAAEGDERAKVSLSKLAQPGKYEWCADFSPEEFEAGGLSLIRSRYGSGEYKIVLYGSIIGKSGLPGFGIRARDVVSIAEDRSAAPVPGALPSGIVQAIEAMAQNQRAMLEALQQRPAQADPMAQMAQMFTLMRTMREAMGDTGGGNKRQGVGDLLRELRDLKELGADLIGGGKPEPDDPLTAALPGILDLVKQATSARNPPPELGAPEVHMPPGFDTPQPTTQDTAMPTITDPDALLAALRAKLGVLIALAAADMEPEQGADVIYEHLPDELIAELRKPTWHDLLCGFEPGAKPHKAWLDRARVITLDWFDNGHPDDEPDDAAPLPQADPSAAAPAVTPIRPAKPAKAGK